MEISNKKIAYEVVLFSLLGFITTKTIKLFYIALHNLLEEEQWPYLLVIRNMYIEKTWSMLISPVILAPIFETFIFCVVLFKLCSRLKLHGYAFVFCSALLFSPYHLVREGAGSYTLAYTFFGGLILAFFYLRHFKLSGNASKAFALTTLVHATQNLLVAYI